MDNSENKSAIKGFMLPIIAGLAILELITIAVFAVIGKFDLRVVWGALWGSAVMILYYFLFARAVTKAASGDPDDAKKRIQASYSARMLLLIALMGAGLYLATGLELINWVPMLLAVIFPRISIALWQLIKGTKNMYTSRRGYVRHGHIRHGYVRHGYVRYKYVRRGQRQRKGE